jgi:hypothetical protein
MSHAEYLEKQRVAALVMARKILTGDTDLHGAIRSLVELSHSLDEEVQRIVVPLVGIASELDDVPIGESRKLWSPDALAVKDRQRDEYLSKSAATIMATCEALITKLSSSVGS